VPNSIITNNGSQFTGRKFLEFCDKFYIRVDWAAVKHPQTNGQVERANGMILQGLKPRIFDKLNKSVLTVKIRQPSHEFTFGVGISFIPYPLVLTPVV
jgi:transposase InsO family protein